MKRSVLMRMLADVARERNLDMRVVEGGRHTKVWIGSAFTAVPRHREIHERLAHAILKEAQK